MIDPKLQLPVEPLSETAWQRVREGVFVELQRAGEASPPTRTSSGWGRRWVMAAGALAAVAAAVLLLRPAASPPSPVSTSARIVATKEVTRTTVGDVTVEVTQGTELVVTGTDGGPQTVVLERGRAEFSVPKRNGRLAFRVHAADVLVEVIGTQFWVSRLESDVKVGVVHGVVRVTSRDEQVLLQAGSEWPATSAGVLSTQGPTAPDTSAPPRMPFTPSRRSLPTAAHSPRATASKLESAAEPTTEASSRERYEAANRLEATDATSAVNMYLVLAREGGPWAANALYAAARLEIERGRRDSGRRLLDEYLTRFPKGTNAREAKTLLERAR